MQQTVLIEDLPIVNLADFLNTDRSQNSCENLSEDILSTCKSVAESFHKYGILIIRDPRVNMQDNDEYIDLMENYFDTQSKDYYAGRHLDDEKPEYHYLVGVTTEQKEKARRHEKKINSLAPEHKPVSPVEPVWDAKWRYYWKIGER